MNVGDWVYCDSHFTHVEGYVTDIDKDSWRAEISIPMDQPVLRGKELVVCETVKRNLANVFPMDTTLDTEDKKEMFNLFIDLAIIRGDKQEFMELTKEMMG